MADDDRRRNASTPFNQMASKLYEKDAAKDSRKQAGNSSDMETHIMRKGDTLWGLSQKKGIPLEKIQAANPHIDDPTKISIGTRVNMPAGNQAKEPTVAELDYNDNRPVEKEAHKGNRFPDPETRRIDQLSINMAGYLQRLKKGTATREEAWTIRKQIDRMNLRKDLNFTERMHLHSFALAMQGNAYFKGHFTFEEASNWPAYNEAALSAPSGGGIGRLPRAPLGAGMNMIRPGNPSVDRLNQEMGLGMPRHSPMPRDTKPRQNSRRKGSHQK